MKAKNEFCKSARCALAALAAIVFAVPSAFAWGPGHDTVARETLKRLQGEWGERLRAGEGGKAFLSAAHAPDDQKTLLADRVDFIDETLRARLTPQNGKAPVMYRFHEPDARCELVLAMSRAMRRGDDKAVGFLLGCFNHSAADTVSANHSPLIQLLIYNWKALGLSEKVDDDCAMLDKSPERKAVFERVAAAACAEIPLAGPEPQSVFDAAYADELAGPGFFRFDRDICAGGEAAVDAFAQEAAYAVRRTVEALLAAESFSRLSAEPTFDKALSEKRFKERATAFLAKRPMADDAITAGVLPVPGHVPSVGVLYDPTGYWTHGLVYMCNRTLAVQIATTLKKRHDAALLDVRELLKNGVPPGVKVVVAPCSGMQDHFGFSSKGLVSALESFVARGGGLVWVGGNPKPPKELFPEAASFVKNTARASWAVARGPVPADEMLGGALVLPEGRFTCVREPRGTAGWYWEQTGLDFLPSGLLPEGCREIVGFEAKDGRRVIMGWAKGRCAFIPALSVFPYIFTETRPSAKPLVLELDATGAAVLESALKAVEDRVSGIPLPEHPRPDWERVEWLNLNGEWDFGFAPDKLDRKILVPFGWGCPLSGVCDEGDTGYYRRSVTVPEAWKGRRVFVVVGASDHDTTCTFDGETLGKHVGGYTPFEYELTEFIRWGEAQTLAFKVWDPPAKVAMEGHYLYGKQGYGNARGIWQTVYLEARGDVFLDSVRFTPSIADKSMKCRAFLAAPAKSETAFVVETAGKKFVAAVKPGDLSADVEIRLDEPHLWTIDDPYLYDAKLTLGDDEVKSYFGFREIGTGKTPNGDSYVTLNGKPVYLQMCLDQSYHPEGWYTFPSDEFMKEEIMISKRLALTGNRVHIKVEVPRKLYWADRLGVLIQADVPCSWGDASEAMFEEHWKCFEGMVKRDFNHPCIYQWTLFNETWGLFSNRSLAMGLASGDGGKKRVYREWTQRMVAEAYRRAKAEDPTRLVEDNSPCNHDHVVTDVNTWHSYCPGYGWENAVGNWCENTFPGSVRNYIGGNVQGDAPMMNSECGNVWGYTGSTGDCDFTWDYHLMINAFRRHLKCSGWLYTEHHDVCNEWNGYMRFDRSPKYDGFDELAGMTIADFHRDAALFFAGRRGFETGEMLCPGQRVAIPVGVSLVTDKYAGKSLALSVSSWHVDDEGRRVESPARPAGPKTVARSWQCEKLWDVDFAAPEGPACGCVCLALTADGRTVAKNFWSFGVTNGAPSAIAVAKSDWTLGATNVLDGLKANGFGKGFFEFRLDAPSAGGVFRAEVSAKRMNGKDMPKDTARKPGFDYMLGGGTYDRSRNPNSYPQTSDEKCVSTLKVFVGGKLAKTVTLPDDPADSRGILSWLSQPHDRRLHEAGSYGYLVEVDVPAAAVKDGKVDIRLEADNGLAVYGPAFGRYPMLPHVALRQ